MSRAWMPFYVGDYLRDTAHLTTAQHGAYLLLILHCWEHSALPKKAKARAAVCRLSLAWWKANRTVLEKFFLEDGTHKRITKELNHADQVVMKRKIAGAKGGFHSAIARAKAEAFARANRQPNGSAITPPQSKQLDTQSQSKKEEEEQTNSVGSLATALPAGALREPTFGARSSNFQTSEAFKAVMATKGVR